MKKNKNIKILLPVVIIIWGLLIYKIVDAFSSDTIQTTGSIKNDFTPPPKISKENFELQPIERDPFFGTMYQKKKVQQTQPINKKKESITWPQIQYLGVVSDKESTASVYIININGIQYLFSKEQTWAEVTLLSGTSNTVSLKYKTDSKKFELM